jgi:pimeloyl-ACP methyl ester carboxylesterase
METVNQCCVSAIMFPSVFTDDELERIELPTLRLIGDEKKIESPNKAAQRGQGLRPTFSADIIPNMGHAMNMEQP